MRFYMMFVCSNHFPQNYLTQNSIIVRYTAGSSHFSLLSFCGGIVADHIYRTVVRPRPFATGPRIRHAVVRDRSAPGAGVWAARDACNPSLCMRCTAAARAPPPFAAVRLRPGGTEVQVCCEAWTASTTINGATATATT